MSRIKICQFTSSFPPIKDGVGDFAAKLDRLFNDNQIESFILCSKKVEKRSILFGHFSNYSLAEVFSSIRLLKKEGINTIIFHFPTTFYGRKFLISLIPLIYRLSGINVILYLHEYFSYSFIGKFRILPMIFSSNQIITTDSLHYSSIRKIYKGKNLTIIPGGTNLNESDFSAAKLNIDENTKIELVYFGFIKSGKGLDVLIDAVNEISEFINDFHLSIIGSVPGNANVHDEKLFGRINNCPNIEYLGFLEEEDLISTLTKMNFMVLPFSDGLTEKRGSFMTATALGLPVLTTKPAIPIDGLKDGENILVVEKLSKELLIDGITKLKYISKSETIEIGNNAKQWYMNNHSEKMIFNKLNKLIFKVQK